MLGPTCSWKSGTAVCLAQALGGEVVSCDSMQVYRGMEIGTAVPSPEERRGVPHHLLGCLPISVPYDVHGFLGRADRCIQAIRGRGGVAILAGGSGLYAKAIAYGLTLLPADRDLAASLQQQTREPGGLERLLAELRDASLDHAVPPHMARNPRRILRAVEILRLTGQPPDPHRTPTQRTPAFPQFVILPDMDVLRPRIRLRTRRMLAAGWIDETRHLIQQGLLHTPTARQALGYGDIADFLAGSNTATLETLEDAIARRTVRFARRQRTWFEHQHPGAIRIHVHASTSPDTLANHILDTLANPHAPMRGDDITIP
ncbi:MAG: tRNA (adenosine(37)-N6)-dimethylallyltransferase MiaA [Lentisphaeria bacterium]|nr:tRNA (adenosine(37)-N6)-dimethylallyltransferase MiaA [Lentisphaeria bacterium]